jgi:hypothetical protein
MSGGGRPADCGRPGNEGGIRWPISGPGRLGMAGAGRPVAGGGGGARDPAAVTGCIGIPRRGPPGEGGDNLQGRGTNYREAQLLLIVWQMYSLQSVQLFHNEA